MNETETTEVLETDEGPKTTAEASDKIESAGKTSVGLYLVEGGFMVAACFLSHFLTGRCSLEFSIWTTVAWLVSMGILCLIRDELAQSYCVMVFATILTGALYWACGSLHALLMVYMIQWLGEVMFLKPSSCIFVLISEGGVMALITLYVMLTGGDTGIILDFCLCIFVLVVADVYCRMLVNLLKGQMDENARSSKEKGELVKKLEVKVQEAQAATRAKSEFLANMSHEIRTPINAILGMNELALRECKQPEITEYMENISAAGKSLLAIINDVLDFSKIEARQMKLSVKPYELRTLLNNAVAVSNVRAEEKRLSLIFNVSPKTPRGLCGDIDRIGQIFNNLTSNALKYTDRGSVTVSVWTEERDEEDLVELYIRVRDTGVGIRKEDINKLFISFQRLDTEVNRSKEGTGLGLALTSRLVNEMGGEIAVESTYGVGSVFTVHFPQKVTDARTIGTYSMSGTNTSLAESYHSLFTAPRAKILVVDDNNMNLMVVSGLLKPTKVQVTLCTGGEECLKLMQQEHFDIILLDHMMPRMDGIEVLTRSKEMPNNLCADSPIVALTANAVAGSRERYLRAGFDDYLSKPIVSEELERLLLAKLPRKLIETVWNEDKGERIASDGSAVDEKTAGDIPIIDEDQGLKCCAGLADMYREVLVMYKEEGPSQSAKLDEFWHQRDWKNYAINVHALKSNSKTIGAMHFAETALMLERAAKEGEEETLLIYHEILLKEHAEVLSEVEKILARTAE